MFTILEYFGEALRIRNPSVKERLEVVSKLLEQRKDLREPLELQERILRIQLDIDNTPTKGTRINWNDQGIIVNLQKKALEEKMPIIHLLDPSIFVLDVLYHITKRIADAFIQRDINREGLKRFLTLVENSELSFYKLVEAILKENLTHLRETAEKLDVQPTLLLYIVSASIQPSLEEVARRADPSLFDGWWQAICPVCGRIPIVARLRDRKRYLTCTFCGAEYLSDMFLCVHCGNKDPYALKYLATEAQPEFQIDFCTKCRHYIKVIDEARMKNGLVKGLEDILTLDLDFVAKNADLVRDY